MMDIRMPQITATTPQGQMEQVRSYLFQMVQQLNFSLRAVEKQAEEAKTAAEGTANNAAKNEVEQAQSTFNSIKSLIIKSADIVNAYYEVIEAKLQGEYVAQSDYGTFKQETEAELKANSEAITQSYSNLQQVLTDLEMRVSEIAANAYIRSGLLGYYEDGDNEGAPIYGIEVGETITQDGVETFNKYARFTSDRLSFYDANSTEVAYISDSTLYINNAVIKGNLQVGKFVFDTAHGLALLWIGG